VGPLNFVSLIRLLSFDTNSKMAMKTVGEVGLKIFVGGGRAFSYLA
jgi:hypothetical protein